jgi:CDP-diacylglycerol--glycerol-3-phosphate 3-phosphatidyltransferase
MTIYDLKPAFQRLLRPLAGALAARGATANGITAAALALSAAEGAAIVLTGGAAWTLLLLPPVLFLRMALNALDGMLAREFAQASPLGAYLNEIGDVLGDALLYLPLALLPQTGAWTVIAFVLAGWMNEFAGVLAWAVGGERRYDGPMGKSDRAFVAGLYGAAAGLGYGGAWGGWLFGLSSLAALAGAWNRIRGGLK